MAIIKELKGDMPKIGERAFLAETATIIGTVEMGDDCSVWYGAVLRGDVGAIRIGDRVNIQDNAVLHATFKQSECVIGNDVSIGHCANVHGAVIGNDVIIGMGACTNSMYQDQYNLGGTFAPIASYKLLECAVNEAKALGVSYKVGNLLSSDVFYNANPNFNDGWYKMGVLGVEMEAAALYMNAAAAGKNALAICTVSDHIMRGEALDSDARQNTFTDMMKIALEVAVKMHNA